MNMEKPENPKMKIVHMKEGYSTENEEEVFKLDNNNLRNIKFEDPETEAEFKRLLRLLDQTSDVEEKKEIEFIIRQLLIS